ncbi:MAG TPA: hypothetical protein VHS78_00870 [Candidatus Elarobacter sp.]|jgi:hypothetical protein|nr:hypothetical protein [Candidatus Elarobacter sp.]
MKSSHSAAVIAAAAALLVTLSLSKGQSQSLPSASPAPSPSPSGAPNPIGPAFGANDPCTSLSAIVGRPSVTNSVCTVRPDHVEVEGGYVNTSFSGGGNAVTYPSSVIRIGTRIPALEVQIAPPSVVRTNAGGITTASTDVGAGLKYVFGYTPKFNWGGQAFFTAPTGLNGGSANGTNATYALNAGYTLSPVFSLATTLATNSLTDGPQRWSSFVPSFVLGASLPNASGAFAEIATFGNANGPGTPARTQYMVGIYRDVGPRLQLDASTAFSLTTATGKYRTLGFGASYYF